jgi:hypothetical protein
MSLVRFHGNLQVTGKRDTRSWLARHGTKGLINTLDFPKMEFSCLREPQSLRLTMCLRIYGLRYMAWTIYTCRCTQEDAFVEVFEPISQARFYNLQETLCIWTKLKR